MSGGSRARLSRLRVPDGSRIEGPSFHRIQRYDTQRGANTDASADGDQGGAAEQTDS